MTHFALQSKKVIIGDQLIAACIEIQGELIKAVHPYGQILECTTEDLGDLILMPGIVDTHVHINEPGRTEWEGFNTATQAAAAGGITTLVDMPLNCIPVTTNKAALDEKLQAVHDKLWVDCGFWGGVIPGNVDQLDELLSAGVLGVKSFLIDSGIIEFPPVTEKDIQLALPILAKHDAPYLIHAELDCGDVHQSEIGEHYQKFLNSRPKIWENSAIELMVKLAKQSRINGLNNKIHIVHLSSDEAIEIIGKAQAEGLKISVETCPHYLTIAAEQIPDGKTLFKCCPPIREENNRQNLWQALKDGVIGFIVSDHSPCTPQLKEIESGDIEKAWGGISALQFSLPLIWTEAKQQGINIAEISRLMSLETSKFAGLDKVKGRIAEGYHADLLIFDDNKEQIISNDMIKHKHKITPYVGRKIFGQIKRTLVRGKAVYDGRKFLGQPIGVPLLKGRMAGI